MKKILIFLIMIPVLLTSCEDWLDVNTDPNTPSDVPSDLIFPAAQASIATRIGGNMFNFSGFFAQYWTQAPEANQYNKIDNYDITAPFLNTDYTELYAGALNDLEAIRRQATAENSTGYYFVATVLRAYVFQVWADLIGDAPYTEALLGVENKTPIYDNGQAIYEGILSEIDSALTNLAADAYIAPNEYLFGGDLKKWIAFANTLKLKIYMRASNAIDYSSEIMALINADNFITEDVAFTAWTDEDNRLNPWYGTNTKGLGTVNNIAALPIISYLKLKQDPRIAALWVDVNGEYVSGVPAMKEELTADYSKPIITATQPTYFITMSELELFKSEAYVRFGNSDAQAKAAYENAIDHNLMLHGLTEPGSDLYGSGKPYEWNSALAEEAKMEQIALQKWVSLCLVNNLEAWCELRRMGYPKFSGNQAKEVYNDGTLNVPGTLISPEGNALGGNNLIQRLPYPERSTRLNPNAPSQKPLNTVIWWDKN